MKPESQGILREPQPKHYPTLADASGMAVLLSHSAWPQASGKCAAIGSFHEVVARRALGLTLGDDVAALGTEDLARSARPTSFHAVGSAMLSTCQLNIAHHCAMLAEGW